MDSEKNLKKRKRNDNIVKGLIYSFSSVGVLIFAGILIFLLVKGAGLVSFDLITGNYYSTQNNAVIIEEYNAPGSYEISTELGEGWYYSSKWDFALVDSKNKDGKNTVTISYIGENSPLNHAKNNATGGEFTFEVGMVVEIIYTSDPSVYALSSTGAENMITTIDSDSVTSLGNFDIVYPGGGIRGSIIATFALILLTVVIAVPLGVGAAVYFSEYAKQNRVTLMLKSLIDVLTGVPSIVFGLMGAAVFIPFVSGVFGTSGPNVITAALTMSILILPVIIKSTQEALRVVPMDVKAASFALGASETQTTFKIVIPSAIPGILAGVILGISRVIGESAALIYVMGTVIRDDVVFGESATTLAVHIWTVMGGEVPDVAVASAIALIILLMVFTLNLSVKLIAKKMNKAWY